MQTDTFKDSPPHPLMLIIINLIIKLLFEITLSSSEVHITMGAVLMVPKSGSLLASIYYLCYQINLINNLLVCIGMIDWYF